MNPYQSKNKCHPSRPKPPAGYKWVYYPNFVFIDLQTTPCMMCDYPHNFFVSTCDDCRAMVHFNHMKSTGFDPSTHIPVLKKNEGFVLIKRELKRRSEA